MGRRKILTKERVLDAINRYFLEHGVPPTVEELRHYLKLGSTRTALRYLRWLEEEGDIKRWSGARGLRQLKAPKSGVETRVVPLIGEAPVGPFMLAEENFEGWIRLPKESLKPPSAKFFMLRVRGDSMNRARIAGEKIEDGDLVLVRPQFTAEHGEVVVAMIDGQATIKRLAKGPGYYLLKPESTNLVYEPIIVDRDFRIQGIITKVIKKGSKLLNLSE